MEESISGFKVTGSWDEIVEHGEKFSSAVMIALKRTDLDESEEEHKRDELETFEKWRPKIEDDEKEVSEKTAKTASTNKGEGEKKNKNATDDIKEAGKKAKETVSASTNLDQENVSKNARETVKKTQRATDSAVRKSIRKVEETVYEKFMTAISPYYFDNDIISANLSKKLDDTFVLEINITDDEFRSVVKEELELIDDTFKRWHAETEYNENVAEAETYEVLQNKRTKSQVEERSHAEIEEQNKNLSSNK